VKPPRWAWLLPALALVAVLAAVVAVMSEAKPRLAGTNSVRVLAYPIAIEPGQRYCQAGEEIPPAAARLEITPATEGRPGPPLALSVGGRAVSVEGGYADSAPLSVPVPEGAAEGTGRVCVRNTGDERVLLGGRDVSLPPFIEGSVDGEPVAGLARITYWREGSQTGWDVAGAAFDHWGLVTAFGSLTPWLALIAFALAFGGAILLAARGRAAALTCGAVALLAAAGWALTTPAFHVPDEPQHVAYAQYLVETGKAPRSVAVERVFSPEEGVVFGSVAFNAVVGNPLGRPPWTQARDDQIDTILARDPGRVSEGGLTNTTNNPPLYYALQFVPLKIASAGDFLDRLLAMRLFSALLAGLTAAFAFLFLREVLPGSPWAWAAGALALAVQPLLGFLSGGVNNDAGLFAAGAAVLWLVARAFRRGLDRGTAIGLGAALGLGLIVKATLVGLVPGLVIALAVLVLRAPPDRRRRILGLGVLAAAVAAIPVLVYVTLNLTVWDRPLWNSGVPGTSTATTGGRSPHLTEFFGYVWQFYLPRLPFMDEQQAGIPLFNVWFKGLIGRYGWLDTGFPGWAYDVALIVFAGAGVLAARALWVARRALVARWAELLAYAAIVAGFLVVVAWAGYTSRLGNGLVFEQTRYLAPLALLYAGLLALASRGAGRRLGAPVGATLVVLACGHAVLSILLVAGRYYA